MDTSDTPRADLGDLYRQGRLANEYPHVPELLAQASDVELARAGRLLARLDPAQVLREHPEQPVVSVAITGHGTLANLVPALTAETARHGLLLSTRMSDFDAYVFDLGDPDSGLYAADPDLVLCVLDAAMVFDQLPSPWSLEDVRAALDETVGRLTGLAARFAATARGTLVLNTLPLPRVYAAQLVDHRSRAGLGAAWRLANARLLDLAEAHAAVTVLDLDPLVSEGVPVLDARLDRYARAHLSDALLAAYAREVGHLCRTLRGKGKKCLVLDLDNTVWGGVLGDDGPEGIEVADSYRGEAFRAFQRVVRQLGSQGVLLTAVSKNDLDPVRRVLREHPRMTLREEDFVRVTANWRPKHENLRELAEALNLGVDSFVFVDDNPYECGLVRRELPGVAVVGLDDEPALHPHRLLRDGWFDVRELTADDRLRPERYREESIRRDFLDSFDSLDDYLNGLGVTVRLERARDAHIARLSQLTLRTNQFNLTTTRLQPPDVRTLAADPASLVLAVHASDRFGDNGLVGALFARRDGEGLHIDNFVLSCRVFSRGIEQTCLAALLRHARVSGAPAVHATYLRSPKNGVVRDLYSRYGFTQVDDDGDRIVFRHELKDPIDAPAHVRLVTALEGSTP